MGDVMARLSKKLPRRIHTDKYGPTEGLRRKGIRMFQEPRTLTSEERFLMGLNLVGKTVYDVGSSGGYFTYLFSRSVGITGSVVAFEPNPMVFQQLVEMISLNLHNTRALNIGVGSATEIKQLIVRLHDLGTGSMNDRISKQIREERGFEVFQVWVLTMDEVVNNFALPMPDFIKVDVEGMEYDVLLGMATTIRKCRPSLHIEIHGADINDKKDNISRVAGFLESHDYSIYHIESQEEVTVANASIAMEGHIFCIPHP